MVVGTVVEVDTSVVVTAHTSSGALTAHRPLTWMALSAHVQKTVHPSFGIHSSCSPWHPKVHEHSSEHTLVGAVVVAG